MIIGITGKIGAGKSVAAEFFKKNGAFVIDADQIGRDVVKNSVALRRKLAKAFGADVLTTKGNLRRPLVAQRAFANDHSRQILNSLVHPYLLRELRTKLKKTKSKQKIIVIDAALLLEWDLDREVDLVLLIHASQSQRIKRLLKKGLSKTDAMSRDKSQATYSDYRKRADIVILNNGTVAQLRRKLRLKFKSTLNSR